MEFIEAHSEYNWSWSWVSYNPNITMEFIEAHPEYKWCWYGLMKNEFIKEKEMFMIEEAKKYIAFIKLKNGGKKYTIHPRQK